MIARLDPDFFLVIGAGVFVFANMKSETQDATVFYILTAIAVSIVFIGINKILKWTVPIVFDRNMGCYWQSRKQPDSSSTHGYIASCQLNDIHAIQLLKESCGSPSKGSAYVSYELNLVLNDSSRLNVVDHRNSSQIRSDADKLSKFLGVPVWDAS